MLTAAPRNSWTLPTTSLAYPSDDVSCCLSSARCCCPKCMSIGCGRDAIWQRFPHASRTVPAIVSHTMQQEGCSHHHIQCNLIILQGSNSQAEWQYQGQKAKQEGQRAAHSTSQQCFFFLTCFHSAAGLE